MKCPKCQKGELKEQITIRGIIFKKKIVYTYCNVCDFMSKKEFRLSKNDIEVEKDKRVYENEVELQLAKNKRESKYEQSYRKGGFE